MSTPLIIACLISSLLLGLLGLLVLGYKTSKKECLTNTPASTPKTFTETTVEAFGFLKEMKGNLGFSTLIVIIVFSFLGLPFVVLFTLKKSWREEFAV